MNISNYSYGDKKSRQKLLKPVHIVLIVVLALLFLGLLVIYIGLKNSVSEENKIREQENFATELRDTFSSLYGYDFTLYITGENNDRYYLGAFLKKPYCLNEDMYIEGKVYESGAVINIAEGTCPDDAENWTYIVLREDGLYAYTSVYGIMIEPDLDWTEVGNKYKTCFVKIADGTKGKNIMPSVAKAILSCDNVKYGKTADGCNGVTIPDGALQNIDMDCLGNILGNFHGDITMSIKVGKNSDGLYVINIDGQGKDISFRFSAVENQKYCKDAVVDEVYSIDEYEAMCK